MALLKVNPTRSELLKLKKKVEVAKRGHKLLKEKRDGLMKYFMGIIREAKDLRETINKELASGFKSFLFVSADMHPAMVKRALAVPSMKTYLGVSTKNVMSVHVPEFKYEQGGDPICYSLATTSSQLDTSLNTFANAFKDMVRLAQVEHSARLLAQEIEKTRRRVNALEHVFIPNMNETIKYIESKLNEQERGSIVTLMKVKELLEKQQG